jgi:hypothetical protein
MPGNWSTSPYSTARKILILVSEGNETEIWDSAIMHEVQFSMNDQWNVSQEIRHVVSRKVL